jgi:glyoxylase-like metal-dependent hydrolase (beta-lactamase superfamily II)
MSSSNLSGRKSIIALDLNFMGMAGAIAAYLVPHAHGAVLVECGPGSTIPALQAALRENRLTEYDITDVLLTHIHLDHAGAAGWLARRGARIHVHPAGAPHLLDPQKLLSSATRIYGDKMQSLWGDFLPVPEERLSVIQDGEVIEIENLSFFPIDTPGHANHHFVFRFEGVCFSGDIGGVRLTSQHFLELPMPPPEFHIEKWRTSLKHLSEENFTYIAPTHFGIYDDPAWHLSAVSKSLDEVEVWMEQVLPADPPIETLVREFVAWSRQRALTQGAEPALFETYQAANPSFMSASGIQRYWRKFRSTYTNH